MRIFLSSSLTQQNWAHGGADTPAIDSWSQIITTICRYSVCRGLEAQKYIPNGERSKRQRPTYIPMEY